jgi:hypothetical protein
MQPVISSTVESVGYDSEAAELHIRFRGSAATYVYQGVPVELFERLQSDPSPGSIVNREIKGLYPFYTV